MAMNNVQLQGRVAFVNYKAGENDKKSFISFAISYNTGKKENPTDQYNKEDLFRCKAWGGTADFIHNYFPERSQILVNGTLAVGQDFTNQNGELVKGGVEIMVKDAHFCGNNGEGATNGTAAVAPVKPAVTPKAAPKAPVAAPKAAPVKPAVRPVIPKR